ncbi:FKBP-type peptidyl-prolyl cis-trans isomerase [Leucobacter sp. UT-8R-CII-1-4]|uniref:FKBP-type peptidyl-prolyl cis-trans isomerase n=1 Tax=Leucobacter sp. UT-8R-CII-1-4 TaxID=3040075 RepID=UPI0024A8D2BC|nr:FKBP-type peptidyl-prolyl cis-trans isomerase [Leucobacter sp. UT-8R-CII-1-4]MDI6022273.1 FKBP-type peptidyl-prolyl cis-trans isomerase [Leucobacter sp. UT-8R-CII-1-4]
MKRSRALLALMPAALIAGLLTSCSPGNTSAVEGVECAPAGSTSKSLDFEGELGAADLKLTTKTPVQKAAKLEVSRLIQGDGAQLKQDDKVNAQLSLFNGTSGELLSSDQAVLELSDTKMLPWALEAVACSSVGDRVAAAAPVADVLGDNADQYKLKPEETLVIVFDLISVEPGMPENMLKKAEGEAQKPVAGLPTVELAANGEPTITIPEGVAAPDKLTVETLIKGEGEKVQEGDRVYVNYRGVIWRTGQDFDSSWSRGTPIDFTTDGVIGGFSKALVGQTVGSQVISIVPAEDGGYGASQLQAMGHEPDDVMVFVLDILATTRAK